MIRKGRRGPFLGCSGYPKCKNTGEVPAKLLEEMEAAQNGNGAAASSNGNGQAHAKGGAKSKKSKADDEIETDLTVD
jgi:ssDNA-binding Zn-finger/Zn-ribbon topoisomerase 1